MAIATVLILLVNVLVLALLVFALRGVTAREHAVESRLLELGAFEPLAPALERSFVAGRKRLLVVEILNPLELAAEKHKLAELAGGVAPAAVRKMVYEVAAKITKEQLEKQNVHATVDVYVSD